MLVADAKGPGYFASTELYDPEHPHVSERPEIAGVVLEQLRLLLLRERDLALGRLMFERLLSARIPQCGAT